jgi:hypothetical protein
MKFQKFVILYIAIAVVPGLRDANSQLSGDRIKEQRS